MIPQGAVRMFLQLFDCSRIVFLESTPDHLLGRVAWEDDPEDFQEFNVDLRQNPLSEDALALADFLNTRRVVEIDRIVTPRPELREMFLKAGYQDWTSQRFDQALARLRAFRVRMIDDGEETDSFFLHE